MPKDLLSLFFEMEAQPPPHFESPIPSRGIRAPNNSPSYGFPAADSAHPRRLSEAPEATAQTPSQYNNSNSFIRQHQATTRLSHSAAAPSLRQSRPRNNSQNQHDEMNNTFFSGQSHDFFQDNYSNPQGIVGQHSTYGEQQNYEQQRRFSQPSRSRNQINRGSGNQEPTVADEHAHFQQRLFSLAQVISAQPGLSSHVVASLTTELHNLSQGHLDLRTNFRNELRRLRSDRERLSHLTSSQQQQIQNALSERDRARTERDRFQTQFTAVQSRLREIEHKFEQAEKKSAESLDCFKKQIRFKDEQINGKRSLWVEKHSHKYSEANQTRQTQDPFATPIARRGSRATVGFEESQLAAGPSRARGFSTNTPVDNPKSKLRNEFWPYNDEDGAEDRNPNEGTQTLIPFKTEEEVAQAFREEFDALYELIEAWVQMYAHTVNDDPSFDQELSHNADLWPFLLGCTYTNFSDAHEHVILLLRNPTTRPFFMTRIIIQSLYVSMWKATAFGAINSKYLEKLTVVEEQLKVKGIEPMRRAKLVDVQTRIVQKIVDSDDYSAFRLGALTGHARDLRRRLGLLLDADTPRSEAGNALNIILTKAWDLSARLFTSNYTILFNFPASGTKFLHPTMGCADPNVGETDLQLHIRQAKIKLAIKPVITMRNDRNMTISAKKIESGQVLVFP